MSTCNSTEKIEDGPCYRLYVLGNLEQVDRALQYGDNGVEHHAEERFCWFNLALFIHLQNYSVRGGSPYQNIWTQFCASLISFLVNIIAIQDCDKSPHMTISKSTTLHLLNKKK